MAPTKSFNKCSHCSFKLDPPSTITDPSMMSTFKMSLLNCHSLPKHTTELYLLLDEQDLDALFLTETWLSSTSDPAVVQTLPLGYLIQRQDREVNKGGGLAIIYKNKFKCRMSANRITDCESCLFSLGFSPTCTFTGILIYRPPGHSGHFIRDLPESTAKLVSSFANFSVIGDLNLHFDKEFPRMQKP